MLFLRFLLKAALTLSLVTAVGQIRFNQRSLENRYHDFVNSDGFQTWFWAFALPVTWTTEKIEDGLARFRKKKSSETLSEVSEAVR